MSNKSKSTAQSAPVIPVVGRQRKITPEEKAKLEKEYTTIVDKCVKYLQSSSGTSIKQLA